jgi:Polyketide cyclase / dehydrase and lipid transport
MHDDRPIITFRASVATTASPDAVYRILSDVSTHLVWAGEQAAKKDFRLLTLDAPSGEATAGTRFSSTGANLGGTTFHDRSVVVQAEPGSRFGFDTDSTLQRKHRPTWHSRFSHRYAIDPAPGGAVIAYTCEVRPQNYRPYWLHPLMRPATRRMVPRAMAKHLRNMARLAETAPASLGSPRP